MPVKAARKWPDLLVFMLVIACSARCADLHVSAAANLANVMPEISASYEKQTGTRVIVSFGATSQLTQQIANGAPMDVFLSADTEHIDQLIKSGSLLRDSRAVYARGRLVVWAPRHPEIHTMNDLTAPGIKHIAIATPSLAPYGAAAVEALRNAGLWDKLQAKAAYASSIAIAKQYADTGNAEAAFTAFALTIHDKGNQFEVDPKLYKPIEQAAGIVTDSKEQKSARDFMHFLAGTEGRAIFKRFGYLEP
jgi:molybdate transport system substrate-binding protein